MWSRQHVQITLIAFVLTLNALLPSSAVLATSSASTARKKEVKCQHQLQTTQSAAHSDAETRRRLLRLEKKRNMKKEQEAAHLATMPDGTWSEPSGRSLREAAKRMLRSREQLEAERAKKRAQYAQKSPSERTMRYLREKFGECKRMYGGDPQKVDEYEQKHRSILTKALHRNNVDHEELTKMANEIFHQAYTIPRRIKVTQSSTSQSSPSDAAYWKEMLQATQSGQSWRP